MRHSSNRRAWREVMVPAVVVAAALFALGSPDVGWGADSAAEYRWSGQGLGQVVQEYQNVVTTRVSPDRIQPGQPFTYSVYKLWQADCVGNCTPCPASGCPPTTVSDFVVTGSTTTGLYRVGPNQDLTQTFLSPPWPNGFFRYLGTKSARGRNTNAPFHVVQEFWDDVTVSAAETADLEPGCYQVGPQPGDLDTTFWFYRTQVQAPTTGSGGFATIQVGDTVDCRQTTTIIIEKRILPLAGNEALRFRFTGAVDGVIGNGQVLVTEVEPGTHTVTEDAYDGWTVSIECDDPTGNSSGSARTATIDVAAGETVRCVFTNRPAAGQLVVRQTTIPSSSTQAFTYSGAVAGSLTNGRFLSAQLADGNYTVSQAPVAGWTLVGVRCGSVDFGASYTISVRVFPGETTECEFVNRRVEPFTVTGAYGYGVGLVSATATAVGGDGAVVLGSASAITRVSRICLVSTWTVAMRRLSPTSINFFWNDEPAPFSGNVSVDSIERRFELLPLPSTSYETVRDTTCGLPTTTLGPLASARLTIGPWDGTRFGGMLRIAGAGRVVSLNHALSIRVELVDGAAMELEVPSSTAARPASTLRQTTTRVFQR